MKNWFFAVVATLTTLAAMPCVSAQTVVGADLLPVFARAAKGEPLRFVALGGSITYNGKGWIGDWLKTQFPQSAVTAVNAGVPAEGSQYGAFRVERDVIAYQPDLVAIEFCVNDWGLPDNEVNRYMESIIVRLKKLPHPPAIIILEAAADKGVLLDRHRKIAQHYGFLEVDLQAAVDAKLKPQNQPWPTFFEDSVHPNATGHAFYAKTIGEKLQPYVDQAKTGKTLPVAALPAPLSTQPLLLDAHLIELINVVGWNQEGVANWPGVFFHGVISAPNAGAKLVLPLRGSTFGIFFQQQQGFGTFTAAVDSQPPVTIDANVAHPYKQVLLAKDLPAGAHTMTITVPSDPTQFKPVKLGYLLVAGDSK